MQSSKLTKSQKRKQRLLKRLETQTSKALVVIPAQNAAAITRRKTAQPKGSGGKRRSRRRSSIPKNSPLSWDQALLRPEEAEGAKIPDMIAYPTGTFQLISYQNLTTVTGGDSCACTLYPIIGDASAAYPIQLYNGATAGNLATVTTKDWNERSSVTGLYSLFRPVSASIEVFYIGTEQNEGGEMAAGCTWTASVAAPFTTYALAANLPDTTVTSVEGGVKVLWKPLDNSHLGFYTRTGPSSPVPAYPLLMVACNGIAQIGSVFHATFIVNFEAIPDSASGNLVQTEPSPYNPDVLRKAWMWAQSNTGTIIRGIEYGARVAGALGYGPNYAFNDLNRRVRRVGGYGRSAALTMMHHVSQIEAKGQKGKEEEDEEFVAEVNRQVGLLNLSEQSSTERPLRERAVEILRGNSPISSPSLARKFSGQKSG